MNIAQNYDYLFAARQVPKTSRARKSLASPAQSAATGTSDIASITRSLLN